MKLTNSQHEKLMAKYYDRQTQANHAAEERSREISKKIPEFEALNRKIREMSLSYAREALNSGSEGRGTATADGAQNGRRAGSGISLAGEIQKITDQKTALLIEHGFPADYLEPVFACPDCRDTGYIGDRRCHCFEREIVNFLYSQSNLSDILEEENFSNFNLEYYPDDYTDGCVGLTPRDNMREILGEIKNYLRNFDNVRENLLLYGNTGVGKTFLTHCIAKELLDRSFTVVYLTSMKLFDILETYKFDRELSLAERDASVSYILDSDLLIIDDLGTELNNSFTSSQLYRCIDTRLNLKRATIISTNLSFDDLREQYSERIFSRITSGYTLFKLMGDDIRLKKALI